MIYVLFVSALLFFFGFRRTAKFAGIVLAASALCVVLLVSFFWALL